MGLGSSRVKGASRSPAPPARLSQTEADELECRAFGRWSNVAVDSQPVATAIGGHAGRFRRADTRAP